jgi:toxin FitB
MNWLIDTCVISELVRPSPDKKVVEWIDSQDEDRLFLSVITFGELEKGISMLDVKAPRRAKLENWVKEELTRRFEGRIIPIDFEISLRWGKIVAESKREGKLTSTIDSLLAATALQHGLSLVTRNTVDFAFANLEVFNPWK